MDEQITRLAILLAIVIAMSGPVALIISIVALNKIKGLRDLLDRKDTLSGREPEIQIPISPPKLEKPAEVIKEQPAPKPVFKPASVPVTEKIPVSAPVIPTSPPEPIAPPAPVEMPKQQPIQFPQVTFEQTAKKVQKETISLEQRIGTRWVLIAGVITVFISAGFFLKFAYEHYWIGPWGRICIAAIAGIVSLAAGEITRRRGYEIAAKGTTALGFAILYAADFTAYRFYDLIGSVPAFGMAIIITTAAMAYAVVLNEVIAAFLALFGGFFTPILVSTGKNMPVPLFGYVLVLSVGAMLCAYWRKWRAVNLLAFIGTFALYCGWFENFFRPQLYGAGPPKQLAIALGWLGIFFAVYLVLPLLYGLVNRAMARKDDVWLVVINASWTFFYLWTILFERHQTSLALCAAVLSAAHLAMMRVVFVRYREDEALRSTLLVIGLAFLTTAIPLYWQMNAAIISWAVEGSLLVFIGIRYRSILTQVGAVAALTLACTKLLCQLPLHTESFRLVLNPAFGVWVFVAAALWCCHFLYKRNSRSPEDSSGIIMQVFYATAVVVLFISTTLEWAAHCKYNLPAGYDLHYISRGQFVIFAAAVLLFAVRPICPKGQPTEILTFITLMAGVIFTAFAIFNLHTEKFLIFFNWDFAALFVFLMSILCCHIKYRLAAESPQSDAGIVSQVIYVVFVLVLICAATFEWAAHCKYNLSVESDLHYLSRGQSIILAIALLLSAVRPICPKGRPTDAFAIITLGIGAIFIVCALVKLHTEKFLIFANWDFAAVFVLLMSMLYCHIRFRLASESPQSEAGIVSQALYAVFGLLFLAAIMAEWHWHCVYNLQAEGPSPQLIKGLIIGFSAGVLGFVVRPLCPPGVLSRVWSAGLAVVGSSFTVIMYPAAHKDAFLIFVNSTFVAAGVLIASMLIFAYLINRRKNEGPEVKFFAVGILLLTVIMLWVVLSEEIYGYWQCRNLYALATVNWFFIASMWMSVAWATYGLILLVGGFWRKFQVLRYAGLSIFGVLLLKTFIVDMSEVSTVYRILAFLATGVTLVGVSYLYQFLKKKGFFDNAFIKNPNNIN
ncbi:MAG: DUF2339 domain-containing protein [Sedimentisphaerales bacterium]|jgi:uncharacterized membrane protein